MPTELRWSRRREPWISCFCCPPNIVRTIAEAGAYAYGRSADRVWVHLYGGSTLDTRLGDGSRLGLSQETDYPWDGRVRISVTAAPRGEWSLSLRIPGWSSGASVVLNGRPTGDRPAPGSYYELRRSWSVGDVVELTLPMPARLLQAHPLVEEARNQVAVQRGPIVYCAESVDLPDGLRVSEVAVPRSIDLAPRFEPALLGGVTVLEGRAQARPEGDWSGRLYRELSRVAPRSFDLKLIPYYAWGNRGLSEMTLWMPLGS
jgi:DUF1680 family protein